MENLNDIHKERLGYAVTEIQRLASMAIYLGMAKLCCKSSDGKFLYQVKPVNSKRSGLEGMDVSDASLATEWRVHRTAQEPVNGGIEVVQFGILADQDGKHYLVASEHLVPRNPVDLQEAARAFRGSTVLQHEIGLTVPDIRDYADLDNGIYDLKEAIAPLYEKSILEAALPKGMPALLPYSVMEITNPN